MRIAVASNEGAYISAGLMTTKQYFVFDVSLSNISYVEKRERPRILKLKGLCKLLKDCKVIYCTQAHRDDVEFFARRGVELDMSEGPIDEKLNSLVNWSAS